MARLVKRSTHRTGRSDGLPGGGALSNTRVDRLRWLIAHPDLLVGVPSDSQDVDDAGRAKLQALCQHMVDLGLYSSKTLARLRAEGIRTLVGEARRRLA